jgi:general stress protein 26
MEVTEEDWLDEQQDVAYQYMKNTGTNFRSIEHTPSFFLSPYVAVWAVESGKSPNAVGWWVITGDLPTDYISSSGIGGAREAMSEFAKRWQNSVNIYRSGKNEPSITLNSETADLLEKRAHILMEWASDGSMWE